MTESELHRQVVADLEAAGVSSAGFGTFGSLPGEFFPPTPRFEYGRAAPILINWIPQATEPQLAETIARSLTGQPAAKGEGARRLLLLFVVAPVTDDWFAARWAIGNALSTLADSDLGEQLIGVVMDRRFGRSRQMLCEAVRKTKHPRAPETLIALIDDDDVSGHAILEIRMLGPRASIPHLETARPRLEAVLTRTSSSSYARQQAHRALKRIAPNPLEA